MIRFLKTHLENNKGLDMHKEICFHFGSWPNNEAINNFGSIFRFFLPRFSCLLFVIYGLGVFPLGVYAHWGEISSMFECLFLDLLITSIFISGYDFDFPSNALYQKLAWKLETMCKKWYPRTEHEQSICDKTQSLINSTFVTLEFCMIVLGIYLVLAFSVGIVLRKLFVGGWYPYDVSVSPYFKLSLVMLTFLSAQLIVPLYILAFVSALLIQTIGQFKLLRYRLEHIRELAEEEVNARKQVQRSEQHLNLPVDIPEAHYSGKYQDKVLNVSVYEEISEEAEDFITCHVPIFETQKKVKTGDEINQDVIIVMERRLVDCVRHHKELCRFVADVDFTQYTMQFNNFVYNLITNVIIVIWITKVETFDLKTFGLICIKMISILEIFIFCWLGDKITDEGTKIRDAAYSMDWFGTPATIQRSMRIIMSRANVPIELTIAGYIPLNLETFAQIMRLSYSYYSTLRAKIK